MGGVKVNEMILDIKFISEGGGWPFNNWEFIKIEPTLQCFDFDYLYGVISVNLSSVSNV